MNRVTITNDVLVGHEISSETQADVVIPSGVVAIGKNVFRGYRNISSVSIPDTVTCIDSGAFQSCTALTAIAADAFDSCGNLAIHAPHGSFAERFAMENDIPFAAV